MSPPPPITIPNFNHAYQFSKLGTYNYTIINAFTNTLSVKVQDVISPSNLTVIISQNSTPIATANPLSIQNELNLSVLANCQPGDVISFSVQSSAASDSAPNQLSGLINILPGS